jgi:hypothetical protein
MHEEIAGDKTFDRCWWPQNEHKSRGRLLAGFDELLAKQLSDTAFVFCLVGILASLRAVQHALKNADSTLSGEHKRVIDEWWWTSH